MNSTKFEIVILAIVGALFFGGAYLYADALDTLDMACTAKSGVLVKTTNNYKCISNQNIIELK